MPYLFIYLFYTCQNSVYCKNAYAYFWRNVHLQSKEKKILITTLNLEYREYFQSLEQEDT